MRIILTSVYVITLLVLFVYELRKTNDLFAPQTFFLLYELLCYPYGLYVKTYDTFMHISDDAVAQIIFVNLIYTISFLLGYSFFYRVKIKSAPIDLRIPRIGRGMTWLLFSIGFASKLYTFVRIGGINAILSNVAQAYAAQSSGFGYLYLLYRFMLFAILIELQRFFDEKNKKDLVYAIIMSFIYMVSYLIYSSRGPAFELVLVIIFVINYKYMRIEIKNFFRIYIIVPLLLVAFLSMYLVNQRNSNNDYARVNNPIIGILDEYCHVGRDAFVYDYFNSHDLFWGRSALNIATFIIPSSIYHDKPVIDDGLFIINNIYGYSADINDSYDELTIKSGSIPFTNQAILYANFSLFGVVLGAFLLAAIRVYFYKKWALSEKGPLICLYFYGVYMFGLTPLYFVNTLTIFIAFYIANYLGRFSFTVSRKDAIDR